MAPFLRPSGDKGPFPFFPFQLRSGCSLDSTVNIRLMQCTAKFLAELAVCLMFSKVLRDSSSTGSLGPCSAVRTGALGLALL